MRLGFGDKIVHLVHGPGVVQGVCERQVNGTPGQFYVIKMMIARADVYVPILETAVLRPVMDRIDLPKLERILGSKPGCLPDKRSMRHALIEQKMIKPDAGRLAEIICDLACFMKNNPTSSSRDTICCGGPRICCVPSGPWPRTFLLTQRTSAFIAP